MREVKFRGFSVLTNRWIYGYGIKTVEGKHSRLFTDSGYYEVHQGSEAQFTGLKDKNDREIYMGDIIKREFEIWSTQWEGSLENNDLAPYEEFVCAGCFIGVVSQTPQGLYVLNKCNKYDDEGKFIGKRSGVKIHAQYAEVIGTFFENPELLESESNAENK